MDSITTYPTTIIDASLVRLALGYAGDQIRAREAKRKALAMIAPDNYELRCAVQDAIAAGQCRFDWLGYRYAVGVQE